jgi:uncharacterized protein YvpB
MPLTQGPIAAGVSAASSPPAVQYLPEGYTGSGFQEYITVLNPGSAGSVNLTLMFRGSAPMATAVPVGARSRSTIDVNNLVGSNREVSVAVDTTNAPGAIVERPMYFHACFFGPLDCAEGSHIGKAAAAAAHWYFAEGYTGNGWQEYLTVQNPQPAAAAVSVRYHFADGSTQDHALTAPGQSRLTVDVNADVGPGKAVSAEVTADRPIAVERPMYFSSQDLGIGYADGGHVGAGSAPATSFAFAEGYTGTGFHEYLALFNPGSSAARADVTFQPAANQGPPKKSSYSVPAGARVTVDVNKDAGPNLDIAAQVLSTAPLAAERMMYSRATFSDANGGAVGSGLTPSARWDFAEGYTGTGFNEYLTLWNPAGHDTTVTIAYIVQGSGETSASVSVPAGARSTVDVNAAVGPGKSVAIEVTSPDQVVAERPMYYAGCLGAEPVCVDQPAVITGLSSARGWTDGGVTLTVQGRNFRAAPAVTFGGAGAPVLENTALGITITVPAHAAGSVDVIQSDVNGKPALAQRAYTYDAIPTSRAISVPFYRQEQTLTCESAAARMALAFEGIYVSEGSLLDSEGVDARLPYRDGSGLRWGNPYTNFVGNPSGAYEDADHGSASGYGTYYPTIVRASRAAGGAVVRASEGIPPADLYTWVLKGHPVVAWVTFDLKTHPPTSYVAFDGNRVMYGAPFEHAVTVSGVTPTQVQVQDPDRNIYWISRSQFEGAYASLDNMAVFYY